jgi:hypothetical protein
LVPEVENEERVFDTVIALQGDVVPRLLYSGPMIGGRHVIASQDCGQTMLDLDAWADNASAQDKIIVGAEARTKLRRLYEAGVLLRKIKAQNIVVDKNNNTVRLIDLALLTDLAAVDTAEVITERAEMDGELRYYVGA